MMKKAVILRCLKSSAGCTGSSCFNILNDKNETLARYGEEGPQILACFTCNGCGDIIIGDKEKLQKKVERIKKLAPDYVHLANCTKKKDENGDKQLCPVIKKMAAEFMAAGIDIVEGMR